MAESMPPDDVRGERSLTTDPTRLTTAALQREIATLRDTIDARVAALREIIEAKLEGMARATDLLQRAADRFPSELDNQMSQLHSLYGEKFHSIEGRLLERDKRFEQGSNDAKIALDTALAAQMRSTAAALNSAKEAVEKSEVAFAKSIDQLGLQGRTVSQSLDNKITDMKDRLESSISAVALRSEAAIAALRAELLPQITGERTRGDRGEGRQMGQGTMLAIIFAMVSAIGVIVGLITLLTRSTP